MTKLTILLLEHVRIQEFLPGGGGGGVGGPGQSDKKALTRFFFFFLVLRLFYWWLISKKTIIFQGFQRGSNIFEGGGSNFSRGGPIAYSL